MKIRTNPSFKGNMNFLNKTRSILVKKCRIENEILTEASYHISLHGEAYIIGESLAKPILKAVESISLSNNSVETYC